MRINNMSSKIALVCENESLSFAELTGLINTVAYNLQSAGVRVGQKVPIKLPRGSTPVVSLFALWRIGAVPIILEDTCPDARFEYICKECNAEFIIDKGCYYKLFTNEKNLGVNDYNWQDFDPAMIFFTSGSTGNPKGVILPAGTINNAIKNIATFFLPEDNFFYIPPMSFVSIIPFLIAQLIMGVTVHIATDSIRRDIGALVEYIERKKITTMFLPPSIASALLKLTSSLRLVMLSSERVRNIYSDKTICICLLGATETAGCITAFKIDKSYDNTPLGQPLDNVGVYVLDDNLQPVKEGEKGEVCVSRQIPLGYLNLPELMEKRFIKNPYSKDENDKILFRTNDIVRYLPNGDIEYVERRDFMLKIRGMRVEPAEIETAILHVAPVNKVVVLGAENGLGETYLFAVYTADIQIDSAMIKEKISKRLPDYMVPLFYEQIESMPINANGKIDRKRISPPAEVYSTTYSAPINALESEICAAFSEALNIAQIGRDDDFVQLGGTSLSALIVSQLVPEERNISATDILSLRKPSVIAQKVNNDARIPILEDRKFWTVTDTEKVIIDLLKDNPNHVGLTIEFPFMVTGFLDVDKLKQAIRILFLRHRILRTRYTQDENGKEGRTYKGLPNTILEVVDLKGSMKNGQEILQEYEKIKRPFSMEEGDLCRFYLFAINPSSNILFISILHTIIDGPSIEFMLGELFQIYNGKITCEKEVRPDSFDFFESYMSSPRYAEEKEFYNQMYKDGIKINAMPWYDGENNVPNHIDKIITHEFDFGELSKVAGQKGVSAFSVIVAASGIMLGKVCNKTDVSFILFMNVRYSYPQLAKTPGVYVDLSPIRLQWNLTDDLYDFVKKIDTLISKIQSNSACGAANWLKTSIPDKKIEYLPLPVINFRKVKIYPNVDGDLEVKPIMFERTENNDKAYTFLAEFNQDECSMETCFKFPLNGVDEEVATDMSNIFVQVVEKFISCKGDSYGSICEF